MLSGLILIIFIGLLVFSGILFKFLKNYFEIFLSLHWIFFINVFVFCILHENIIPVVVGGGFFLLDLILRMVYMMIYRKENKNVNLEMIEEG